MVAEVNVASAAKQAVQSSAAEPEQNQPTRRAANNQPAEGVEVRISQRQAESAEAAEDLTYENIRPRNGSAPQAERGSEPRATDRTPEPQAEQVIQEEVQVRESNEAQRASESASELT
jgi:hypothetical protein